MLALTLLLGGLALLGLAFADKALRRLPLTPALAYLLLGGLLGAVFDLPDLLRWREHGRSFVLVFELALLVSLVAVGLRLQTPLHKAHWRHALILAGPAMAVFIVFGAGAAMLLLGLPWPLGLLLSAVLAPTDPILATEVQIRSDSDRDIVRVGLSAEGGLNDGTAYPVVMGSLALAGLHDGAQWWWQDLLWPIGGGALVGLALGALLGRALHWRAEAGDALQRHELLLAGIVALCLGVAHATATSSFIVGFVAAATMVVPSHDGQLAPRLHGFGASIERLVEAVAVTGVGVALHALPLRAEYMALALLLILVVRPLATLLAGPRKHCTIHQRRLTAWFGIRGIGSLFYLALVLGAGLGEEPTRAIAAVTLVTIATSIVLHGVSATPLMGAYQRRRRGPRRWH
jgi:NhaP-type Na+/H+ or K+/H+ antiporter